MIDGVDNNDDAVAGVRSTMSQEAVQEFQINRSNYSAEFGRASGGLINIVSKSGSNQFHGDVFGFFRDQALDARNPFAFGAGGVSIHPPYSRQQAGFTLGGPIKSNRTFFFLSYGDCGSGSLVSSVFCKRTVSSSPLLHRALSSLR